jgi:hypothetical protein
MGHGEPVTVPLFVGGIEEVNFYMGFGPGSNWLVRPAKLRLLGWEQSKRALTKLLYRLEHLGEPREPDWGAVRVDVWGERGSGEVHEMACGVGQMREVTGLSLAVGTLMVGRNETLTQEGGVYGPEACLDPVRFLTELKERGVMAYFDLEMTRPVV